jgi:hypothetical protein
MQTVRAVVAYEVEVTGGTAKECAEDLASKLDGYLPPGGDLDYQVTEATLSQLEVLD